MLCSFTSEPSVKPLPFTSVAAAAQAVGPLLRPLPSSRPAVALLVARAELAAQCVRRAVPPEPVTRTRSSLGEELVDAWLGLGLGVGVAVGVGVGLVDAWHVTKPRRGEDVTSSTVR